MPMHDDKTEVSAAVREAIYRPSDGGGSERSDDLRPQVSKVIKLDEKCIWKDTI